MLVLLDDILIYIKEWESHMEHVYWSLQLLRDNQLFFKHFKCVFGAPEVEYLGHILSQEGV
jgi:hypothetical protein